MIDFSIPSYMYQNEGTPFNVFVDNSIKQFVARQGYNPKILIVNPVHYEKSLDLYGDFCEIHHSKLCGASVVKLYPALNRKRYPLIFKGIRTHA